MELSETIRVKYASGMYSNTDLVIEYAAIVGALRMMQILTYKIDEDIRTDLKIKCLEMPRVHEIHSMYHRLLRQEVAEIEDTNLSIKWKDEEMAKEMKRLKFKLTEELRPYSWLTPGTLASLYHD